MTSIDVPRNQSQKLSALDGINVRETTSPVIFYLCPVGKTASVKGFAECDSTGAAASVRLNVAGASIATWKFSGGVTDPNVPNNLTVGTRIFFDVQLKAGETIGYTQSSGTNASFNLNATVQEVTAT